jgi:plastocyanin
MQVRNLVRRSAKPVIVLVAAATVTVYGTLAAVTLPQYVVSQKGREFSPGNITIKRGEAVQIVNDDGDLRHHAYIDSDKFSYDSGDQEPGTKTSITFPVAGDFDVLCAIHPKMKLAVHVK